MNLKWTELVAALAMATILEGMLPFLSPPAMRRLLQRLVAMTDRELRLGGLFSMLVGLVILYLVRA
jgi:uncharacterized protein YjeT (DUF2065 family)